MTQQNKKGLEEFTNLYPVQKTLRFALKPVGETQAQIDKKGLLKDDEERAEKYKMAKKVIDEYHKEFINQRLKDFSFSMDDLEKYKEIYSQLKVTKNDKNLEKGLKEIQKNMRGKIAKHLENKRLFDKELIKEDIPKWLENHPLNIDGYDSTNIIKDFSNWTTYFKGFHENRKNIYTNEEHTTGIGYRVVHENLPRFINNLVNFNKAKQLGVEFEEVEDTLEIKLDEVFSLNFFNRCLTQAGIEHYNMIRGGVSGDKSKIQGVNEKVNLHAQQLQHHLADAPDEKKSELKKQIKNIRSCKLEELYKQILSDRSQISFRLKGLKSDGELVREINDLFPVINKQIRGKIEVRDLETLEEKILDYPLAEKIIEIVKHLEESNPERIYLKNDLSLTQISQSLFKDWELIKKCLENYVEEELLGFDQKGHAKKLTKSEKEKWLKKKYFSFSEIHDALEKYGSQFIEDEVMIEKLSQMPLTRYFQGLETTIKEENISKEIKLFENIYKSYEPLVPLLKKYENSEKKEMRKEKEDVHIVKCYLDAIQYLFHFLKPLDLKLTKKDEQSSEVYEKDMSFYGNYDEVIQSLKHITLLFNQARNYLTQKPYSITKYKLNFENSTLGNGWDKNKETDNTCIIFIKDSKYYLGVMDKKHNKLFSDTEKIKGKGYRKMEYKLLPGASKMLPKVFFSNKNINDFSPSEKILDIRNTASHTKGGTSKEGYQKKEFNLSDCRTMIDFFKGSIAKHPEWKSFNFDFSNTNSYESIDQFYREVEHQGYKISFVGIKEEYIHQCIDEGKLYLFQIYSKDFSEKTKGNPNLQTLYWKALFDNKNLENIIYKLNGEIELFHRKSSLNYTTDIWKKGHHSDDPQKKQTYPIIKDRRYAVDTYLFHVPITLNFKADGVNRFNDKVNGYLKDNPDVNIIGIDRGERHLAYYTVINQKGTIIKDKDGEYLQGSLNNPTNQKDYQNLLGQREKERDKARKSWGTIETIKNLKEGYLSQIVHKLATLMVEHNAIIVFEDLNFGFKKGRFKVEKQIYQKLEKMLIDKLNYLIFKHKDPQDLAGTYRALQLCDKFTSFKKLGKQTGFIFYVPAYHTSKVCPATGFVNLLYPRYETKKKSEIFFNKFEFIRYNPQEKYFEFKFNYKNFTDKAEGSKLDWTLCSYGSRLVNFRNSEKNHQWDTKELSITDELKKLFIENKISYEDGQCIKSAIVKKQDSQFFKSLFYLLRVILQLRNSRINSDEDWMLSPIKSHGNFFDSRKAGGEMPQNADANGAYHIGLKGLMLLSQLNKSNIENFKPDLSNKAWYSFIQNTDAKFPIDKTNR